MENEHGVYPKSHGDKVDMNYRKMRESCEKIANALGLNTAGTTNS